VLWQFYFDFVLVAAAGAALVVAAGGGAALVVPAGGCAFPAVFAAGTAFPVFFACHLSHLRCDLAFFFASFLSRP